MKYFAILIAIGALIIGSYYFIQKSPDVTPVEVLAPVPRLAKLIVPPLAVKLLSGIMPPIVPCRVIVPVPAVRVRFLPATSPLSVPVIKIAPAPVPVERVELFPLLRITFPVRVMSLLTVVMFAPRDTVPVKATAPLVEIAPV